MDPWEYGWKYWWNDIPIDPSRYGVTYVSQKKKKQHSFEENRHETAKTTIERWILTARIHYSNHKRTKNRRKSNGFFNAICRALHIGVRFFYFNKPPLIRFWLEPGVRNVKNRKRQKQVRVDGGKWAKPWQTEEIWKPFKNLINCFSCFNLSSTSGSSYSFNANNAYSTTTQRPNVSDYFV